MFEAFTYNCAHCRHKMLFRVNNLVRITLSQVRNFSSEGSSAPQHFKHFLIVDFEATCDSGKLPDPQEIIEFPCLKVNSSTFEIEAKFHRYVRPAVFPRLTPFCTQLTGIVQEMIDSSPSLVETLEEFNFWLKTERLTNESGQLQQVKMSWKSSFVRMNDFITDYRHFLTNDWLIVLRLHLWPVEIGTSNLVFTGSWGKFRLWNEELRHRCSGISHIFASYRYLGVPMPTLFHQWIDLKKPFCNATKVWPKGLADMLKIAKVAQQGRLHSGIDDVKNMTAIMKLLSFNHNITFKLTSRL